MNEWIAANWQLVAIAAAVLVLIVGWLILTRRRTRVEREVTSVEPAPAQRNHALIDAPPAASAAAPGPLSGAANSQAVAAAPATTDAEAGPSPDAARAGGSDLSRLKGVGPKLVGQLGDLGVTTLAQVAAWDDAEIDRIDAHLGRFSGRIRRDAWVEQARLLESGDVSAYESRFGKG